MKDSGIPWIGEIPENWEVKRLKQESIFINGFAFDSEDFKIDEGVRVIRIGDIGLKADFENCVRAITNSSILKPYRIEDGDILIAMSGATTGKCCIVDKSEEAYINQRVGIIRSDIRKIIYYSLQTPYFMEFVNLNNAGSAQPNISSKAIGEFPILSIPTTEQQKIAEFLDRKCAEVDEMIVLQEQIIEELKAYKQSVITEAVTKGLNPAAPMRDSGIEWFPLIPANWEIRLLKRLCANITDGSHFSPNTTDEGKPYITVSDVYNDTIHYETAARISNDDFEALVNNGCQPPVGAVLLAKDGTVGRTAIVENNNFVVLSSLGILTPNEFIISTFLKYLLDSNPLQEQMKLAMAGSALKRITITKICKLIGVIPSNQEQKEITDYLDTKCTEIDNLISIKQSKIDSLKEYKKSIIYEYVTGKREITE